MIPSLLNLLKKLLIVYFLLYILVLKIPLKILEPDQDYQQNKLVVNIMKSILIKFVKLVLLVLNQFQKKNHNLLLMVDLWLKIQLCKIYKQGREWYLHTYQLNQLHGIMEKKGFQLFLDLVIQMNLSEDFQLNMIAQVLILFKSKNNLKFKNSIRLINYYIVYYHIIIKQKYKQNQLFKIKISKLLNSNVNFNSSIQIQQRTSLILLSSKQETCLLYKTFNFSAIQLILEAKPSPELRPQSDEGHVSEKDMELTFNELETFAKLRKVQKLGPVSLFKKLRYLWSNMSPQQVAEKVKIFFKYYALNRHKVVTITASFHAKAFSQDDNRFDFRQFLYNWRWPWQFKKIDENLE